MGASHPSFVAGHRANASENRLFAPPDNGLRGARFRDLSPQAMQTIGEIVPDILERWTGCGPRERYDPGKHRIKEAVN